MSSLSPRIVYIWSMNGFESIAENAGIPLEAVMRHFEQLDARAQEILAFRYGFVDGKARTLEECAEAFSVSREQVRQIEQKAFARMRHPTP